MIFDCASEMASEATASVNLIGLVCITVSLSHTLIDPSLSGAMAIAYGVCETVTVNDRDSSATA